MKLVRINEKNIFGLSARTNNQNELSGKGKIAGLVQRFDELVKIDYKSGARIYSVYYDYESDASGDYSVLIGADNVESSAIELQGIKIQGENYLVFSGMGQVPQVVFETWSKVWDYFSNKTCPYRRTFLTDFEFYKNQNEIEIHIGIDEI